MLVIPAIDIKEGKCVRLYKGLKELSKVYFEDPVEVARLWEDMGAKRLHVVDLDGAFEGKPINIKLIEKMVKAVNIPIEVGGGIRGKEIAKAYIDAGVYWVIIGTLIVENFSVFEDICYSFPEKIIAGIDGKKGKVAVRGWVNELNLTVVELAAKVDKLPIESIIVTEISRDGTLEGVEREITKSVAEKVKKPVIASGGVASIKDIVEIKKLEPLGVKGIIVGKALYEKRIDLKEAIRIAENAG